jgi:hypothetical protein
MSEIWLFFTESQDNCLTKLRNRFQTVLFWDDLPNSMIAVPWKTSLEIDRIGECLRQHVQDCCAGWVFNFDEVGISEWEDRVAQKVIVPVSMSGQMIHDRVHHNLNHISVVCCVSTSGESMTPFMVFSQVNHSVIERLKT